jgi:hypothetical protein
MRRLFIAVVAVLVLSGCKTSDYTNPLKIETDRSWHHAPGVALLVLKWFEVFEP